MFVYTSAVNIFAAILGASLGWHGADLIGKTINGPSTQEKILAELQAIRKEGNFPFPLPRLSPEEYKKMIEYNMRPVWHGPIDWRGLDC